MCYIYKTYSGISYFCEEMETIKIKKIEFRKNKTLGPESLAPQMLLANQPYEVQGNVVVYCITNNSWTKTSGEKILKLT